MSLMFEPINDKIKQKLLLKMIFLLTKNINYYVIITKNIWNLKQN